MPILLNVQAYRGTAPAPPIGRRFGREGGVVGRGAGCDLVLDDPTKYVSRAHARVEFRDGGWFLVDIGTNPSLVNGQPLGPAGPARLAGGERIDIGDYALVATLEPEQVPDREPAGAQPMVPQADPAPMPAAASAESMPLPGQAGDSLAAASILNVGGPFAAAFDAGFDPLGLNPAPPSTAPAWRGAESDHAPPEQAAFVMPSPAASPVQAIPHDYDPLADLLARPGPVAWQPAGAPSAACIPPPQPAPAPGAAPAGEPAPLPEPAPAAVPQALAPPDRQAAPHPAGRQGAEPETGPDTEPAMRTVLKPVLPPASQPVTLPSAASLAASSAASPAALPSPAVAAVPATPQPAAGGTSAPATAADDSRVLQALLRGLGLPDLHSRRDAEELAELAGSMLREATAGTIGVLMARTLTKRESRVEMTMIAPQANNPLKFFPDAATALTHMLQGPLPGYLPPERAFAGAFVDLRAHELAVMAGTRAALAGVLRRFDPAAIEERLHEPGLLEKVFTASRKTRMWDQLVELYGQLALEADEDFQRLFGEAFAVAYEEQVRRLRDAGH